MRSPSGWRHRSSVGGFVLLLIVATLGACNGEEDTEDATDSAADAGAEVSEDVAGDVVEDVAKGNLQWRRYEPEDPIKMRALAAVPGKPGSYVVVGDKARVWRFDGSASNLRAVWVASDGRIVVGGAGNALLLYDGQDWQPAPVNPAQPVTFRAIAGDGGAIWAVGDGRNAWRYKEATWLSEAVTVAADGGTQIGGSASFVGVAVDAKGVPWLVADQAVGAKSLVLKQKGDSWQGLPLPGVASDIWLANGADADPKSRVFVAGGIGAPLVAIYDGSGFAPISSDALNWKQGFTSLDGLDHERVWAAGLKGQLRKRNGDVWDVVNVASAFGVTPSFSVKSSDLVDVAMHGEQELVVLTDFTLYRYAVQP